MNLEENIMYSEEDDGNESHGDRINIRVHAKMKKSHLRAEYFCPLCLEISWAH